jgi:hypothetical protein
MVIFGKDTATTALQYCYDNDKTCDYLYMRAVFDNALRGMKDEDEKYVPFRGRVYVDKDVKNYCSDTLYFSKDKIFNIPRNYEIPWYWTKDDIRIYRLLKYEVTVKNYNSRSYDYLKVWNNMVGEVTFPPLGKLRKALILKIVVYVGKGKRSLVDVVTEYDFLMSRPVILACLAWGIDSNIFAFDGQSIKVLFTCLATQAEFEKSQFIKMCEYVYSSKGICLGIRCETPYVPVLDKRDKRRNIFKEMNYRYQLEYANFQEPKNVTLRKLYTELLHRGVTVENHSAPQRMKGYGRGDTFEDKRELYKRPLNVSERILL